MQSGLHESYQNCWSLHRTLAFHVSRLPYKSNRRHQVSQKHPFLPIVPDPKSFSAVWSWAGAFLNPTCCCWHISGPHHQLCRRAFGLPGGMMVGNCTQAVSQMDFHQPFQCYEPLEVSALLNAVQKWLDWMLWVQFTLHLVKWRNWSPTCAI